MKYRTHRQRLDTLQTRIKSAQAAARDLSKPTTFDHPYTFIEVGMLRDLVYQLDEVQEQMHSVFVEQSANDMWMVRMQDLMNPDNDQSQEAAENDA
jgi:hypothetical protein